MYWVEKKMDVESLQMVSEEDKYDFSKTLLL